MRMNFRVENNLLFNNLDVVIDDIKSQGYLKYD